MRKALITGGLSVAAVAVGLAGFVTTSSAHTPVVTADCDTLSVALTNYNTDNGGTNTVKVTVNGAPVVDQTFTNEFTEDYVLDGTRQNDYVVVVTAHDDPDGSRGWTKTFTAHVDKCVTPPPATTTTTTAPSTTTTTSPASTTTTTTAPSTTTTTTTTTTAPSTTTTTTAPSTTTTTTAPSTTTTAPASTTTTAPATTTTTTPAATSTTTRATTPAVAATTTTRAAAPAALAFTGSGGTGTLLIAASALLFLGVVAVWVAPALRSARRQG